MEYVCSGVARKLCQPKVSISISGLRTTSGSSEQMSAHFAAMSRAQRICAKPCDWNKKPLHVLRYKSNDRGHMVIECSPLREISKLGVTAVFVDEIGRSRRLGD